MTSSKNQHKGLPPRIEDLLRQYYAGATDSAKEKELAEYFAAAKDIPEEYAVDAMIFRQIAAHQVEEEMPEELERRLIKATCGEKSKIMPRWAAYCAAAVVAAVIASISLWHFSSRQSDLKPIVAESIARIEKPKMGMTDARTEDVTEKPAERNATQIDQTPVKVRQIVMPETHRHDSETIEIDPYIEISDPDSVAEITRDVLDRLGAAMALAGQMSETVKSGLEPVESSMGNILNPISTIDKTIKTITQ